MRIWPGRSYPLGASWDGAGVNFALFSEHATKVELCLFDAADAAKETHRIPLKEPDRVLELLSIAAENERSVTLRFAADRAIRLEIDRLACHLGDVGEPWPTPWKPAHPA